MKFGTVKNKFINKGRPTKIYYPISDVDINNQLHEILTDEYYKPKNKDNDICVDIGANIGMATMYFKNFCKRIYSIEPSPENYIALVNNVGKFKNIKTFNHAIYTTNQPLKLLGYNNEPPQTTRPNVVNDVFPTPTSAIYVPCKTLEQFMKDENINVIDVLKIDVEGSEYEIFLDETFDRIAFKIKCIVGETHFTSDGIIPQLAEYTLQQLGFKFKFLKGKRTSNTFKKYTYSVGDKIVKESTFPLWTNFIAWR